MDRIYWETFLTVTLGDLVREGRTHGTIGVDDVTLDSRRQAFVERQFSLRDQLVVQSDIEAMILLSDIESSNTRSEFVSWCKDQG
jgi:hypothetical protein